MLYVIVAIRCDEGVSVSTLEQGVASHAHSTGANHLCEVLHQRVGEQHQRVGTLG